jgi:thymidylate synthase
MNNLDKQYKELIEKILNEGTRKSDRTGTGTISIFGHQMRFKMDEGFPLLTLRKIHTKSVIHEMLWFLSSYDEKYNKFGNTNIRYLNDMGVTFWNEWPYEEYKKRMKYSGNNNILNIKEFEEKIKDDDKFALEYGSIGPGYGEQWLNHGSIKMVEILDNKLTENDNDVIRHTKQKVIKLDGINQIDQVIETLKKNPDSRRMIVDAWNPMRLEETLLPPCHMMFQFYTVKIPDDQKFEVFKKWAKENNYDINGNPIELMKKYKFPDRYLSLQLYQRSVDSGLGLPFNIAEYSLLLHMMAQITNMIPYEFIWTGGDIHIYNNHIEQMKEILKKESFPLPNLVLNKNIKSIYDFRYDDIKIINYQSNSNIKMEVSV